MNGDYQFTKREAAQAGLILWILEGTRRNGKSKKGTFRRPEFTVNAMEHFGEYATLEQVETLARQLTAVIRNPLAASRFIHSGPVQKMLQDTADRIRANRSVPAPKNETAKKMLAYARKAAGQEDKTTTRSAAQPKGAYSRERMEKGLQEYVRSSQSSGDVRYVSTAIYRALHRLPPRDGLEEAVAERMKDTDFRSQVAESAEARDQSRIERVRKKGHEIGTLHQRMEELTQVQRERGEIRNWAPNKTNPKTPPPTLIHGPKWEGLLPKGDPARKKTGNGKPKGPPRPRRKP